MELESIGREIAAARKSAALTLTDLAAKAGLSRGTIYLLESGRATDIGHSKLVRILAALGMELRLAPITSARPTLEDLIKERGE